MTKLIVKPLDPDAPGSFKKRRAILERLKEAEQELGADHPVAGFLAIQELVLEQLSTDDDTPVDDALDELSSNQFDELLEVLLSSSVPTTSADN